jgi:hypothetical protein
MRRLVAVAVFCAAACSPAPREFPIGFYGVRSPKDARELSAKGYNGFMVSAQPEELIKFEREALGAMLVASPLAVMVTTYTAAEFPSAVWYLQDEPDVWGVDLAAMKALEANTLAWAPGAMTAFVVGDGRKAKNYPGVADVIMVDWYPVPHLPLESAGDHVRMTAEAAGGRKVWAVLQAMNWLDFPHEGTNKRRVGRFPSAAEIRFMSYDAVLNGAQGIWYFTYSTATGANLSQTPETMSRVDSTAGELLAMAPIFARGRAIPLPFEAPIHGLRARAWTYHGRDYLLLVNRTKDRQWKVPEEALKPSWRPLFEARRDPRELLKKHQDAYYLKPYQVLVLESRLRPKRLFGR